MRADDALQAAISHADMASQLADTNPYRASVHAAVSQAWSAIAAEHIYVEIQHTDDDLEPPAWLHRAEGSA